MIRQLLSVLEPETARNYRRQILRSLVYAVLEGLTMGLTLPTLASLLDDDRGDAPWWLLALAVSTALTLVAHAWTAQRGMRAAFDAVGSVQESIIRRVQALPVDWFTPQNSAAMLGILWPGSISITRNVLLNLGAIMRGLLTPLIVLVFAATVSWQVALVMVAAVPVLLLVHRVTTRRLEEAEEIDHRASADAAARVIEFAEAQETLRSARRENLGMTLFTDALDAQDRAARKGVGTEIVARAGFGTAVSLAVAAIIGVAAAVIVGRPDDVVPMVAVLTLALRFSEPVSVVADMARVLRTSRATTARTVELLRTPLLPEPAAPVPLPRAQALPVRFDDVTFRYPGTQAPALDGITLDVPAGHTVAVVGASGAGKSTLLRLVARFSDVTGGAVSVGGVDVRDLATTDLYRALGVALQDVVLLDTTIRENVLLGKAGATEEELARAAALAGVDEIVGRLPLGWETPVGAQGGSLSGGERQRVNLARIALQDPPVVLLDEVTAALDPLSERVVQDWIASMGGRKTLVVVAHRLHTVMGADTVVVLDGGRIVESGPPAELAAADGPFAAMLAARRNAAGWTVAAGVA